MFNLVTVFNHIERINRWNALTVISHETVPLKDKVKLQQKTKKNLIKLKKVKVIVWKISATLHRIGTFKGDKLMENYPTVTLNIFND